MTPTPIGISVLVGLVCVVSDAQVVSRADVDDPEMYSVYASLLPSEWIVRVAKATTLVIQEETATNWSCMPSGTPMETDWKAVLDAYRAANATARAIRPGQQLGLPYQVVSASTIAASFDTPVPNIVRDRWDGFRRRYPDSGGYFELSVVGFDPARRRAMVYVAHHCGGMCGGGVHHLLERDGDTWREAKIPGVGQCSWAS